MKKDNQIKNAVVTFVRSIADIMRATEGRVDFRKLNRIATKQLADLVDSKIAEAGYNLAEDAIFDEELDRIMP